MVSIGKRQALSQEGKQVKRSRGTEIQKAHVFANFQMEVIPTKASALVPEMEIGLTEASPSVSRVAEKKETEEKETVYLSRSQQPFSIIQLSHRIFFVLLF